MKLAILAHRLTHKPECSKAELKREKKSDRTFLLGKRNKGAKRKMEI